MKMLFKLALVLLLAVSSVSAQTAEHKPASAVPAVTPAPTAPSFQQQSAIQRWSAAQYDAAQKQGVAIQQSARVDDNSAQVPAQVRLVAFQAERHNENAPRVYTTGNSLGNELGAAVSRSVQMHRFHSYVKKTCQRYGSGTSWVWMFSNGQTVEGTCD